MFPGSIIGFCLVHIQRNLETLHDFEMMHFFFQMKLKMELYEPFIEYLKNKAATMDNAKGKELIMNLVRLREHRLPSVMAMKGICIDYLNTGRVECIFSKLKSNYIAKPMNLTNLINRMNNLADLLIVQSLSRRENDKYFPLIFVDEENKIGMLYKELVFAEILKKRSNPSSGGICCWCVTRLKNLEYAIPCCHILDDNPKIHIRNVPARFIREDYYGQEGSLTIQQKPPSIIKNDYKSIMAKIAPYASVASKVPEVNNLFEELFKNVESVKRKENERMPSAIIQQGQPIMRVSKNVVLAGKQKSKKVYKCSICGEIGHNCKKCLKKKLN